MTNVMEIAKVITLLYGNANTVKQDRPKFAVSSSPFTSVVKRVAEQRKALEMLPPVVENCTAPIARRDRLL